jgi:hypothetical protein
MSAIVQRIENEKGEEILKSAAGAGPMAVDDESWVRSRRGSEAGGTVGVLTGKSRRSAGSL